MHLILYPNHKKSTSFIEEGGGVWLVWKGGRGFERLELRIGRVVEVMFGCGERGEGSGEGGCGEERCWGVEEDSMLRCEEGSKERGGPKEDGGEKGGDVWWGDGCAWRRKRYMVRKRHRRETVEQ